jgi:hypothetical protein
MAVGTDATHPATNQLIGLAASLLGSKPLFFGRYFKGPHIPVRSNIKEIRRIRYSVQATYVYFASPGKRPALADQPQMAWPMLSTIWGR